ncbi:thiamine ABC transporter substrate-binding protein [Halococcus dombrowskii]|uniref:Thiamine ABC transporter substrate binding subunit n=1 Tax=Halococcus dombrowskii TaxID=179637 RepID=A0AAV3SEQ9_HALDO|nr:thiamine ABC transporter substrate-binding protein [Halococcus dombrowskii]UOO95107.1 thiamine ABC transporter substrate-binding protein [Halococcus dombrowskii]
MKQGTVTRRGYLAGASAGTLGVLAGCVSSAGSSPDTLRVGAREAYVNAVSTSAGEWVKKQFEKRHGTTIEWVIKEQGMNDFIQRRKEDAPLDADAYVGVTPSDLVRADRVLTNDIDLFSPLDTIDTGSVVDEYWFDPQRRIVPTGASHVCIVYNDRKVSEPASFDALLDPEYSDGLLMANPQTTVTGLDFLLWTIHAKGRDDYLDYWEKLMKNNVRALKSWNSAYSAYESGEAPMVVSYSTDQIYATNEGKPLAKHRIGFPNDTGYAYISGVGKFADTDRGDLVDTFAQFLIESKVQRRTAVLNVGFPAVEDASLPKKYQPHVKKPETVIQYSVDELRKHADRWRSKWARQVASK